jgi:conjugative transfer signal peptidase TraF
MRTHFHRSLVGWGVLLLAAVAHAGSWSPLRIATGDSLPKGLYWLTRETPLRDGIALVCLPEKIASFGRSRGYLRAGTCAGGARPVGKSVAAVAGDFISLGESEVRVNGVRVVTSSRAGVDSEERPLHRVPDGTYQVHRGEVWLISAHHPRSWDSRYFGPVSERDIVGELHPIWVLSTDTSSVSFP